MGKFQDRINSEKPTLVDFHAVWCGPCKMMEPILKSVHVKWGDRISFIKVDIDKNPDAARAYKIMGVPTLILFQSGKIKWRQSGVVSAADLESILKQHILPSTA